MYRTLADFLLLLSINYIIYCGKIKTTLTCEAIPIDTTDEPQTEKGDFKSESATINEDVVEIKNCLIYLEGMCKIIESCDGHVTRPGMFFGRLLLT